MSKLTDRISYLQGLAAGLKLNTDKNSNKLLLGILDVLGEVGSSIETLEKNVQDLSDYVEDIDEDLSSIESDIYGEDEEGGTCGECGRLTYNCPHCGHEVQFDADDVDFDENAKCPECGHELFPEGEPLDECKSENGCCKAGEQSGECCCKGKQTEKEADAAEKNG